MTRQLFCFDFETEASCDLKACGAWVYSQHPDTNILCLCWNTLDGKNRGDWTPGDIATTLDSSGLALWNLVHDPDILFMAHNVLFEKAIWRNIMMPVYGFPDIPDERWHDTMAVCAEKGLPLALDKALVALKLPNRKDKEGSKFTIGLSKFTPQGSRQFPAGYLDRVVAYCHHDVDDEIALHKRILWQEASERDVWLLDQKINQRGVKIDLNFVHKAIEVVNGARGPEMDEFFAITRCNLTQRARFMTWLQEHGSSIPNLQKETVASYLGYDEHGDDEEVDWEVFDEDAASDVRRALTTYQLINSSSIAKLPRMLQCTDSWGVARNLLQYHGAGPGRWAGRLLQPQNFPRPTLKMDDKLVEMQPVVDAIMTGDWEYVRDVVGPPIETVVGGLRHALVSRPGKVFVVGDFAGVEARLVLALAGQHDKTALMASGADVYCDMAKDIFRRPVTKADLAERQTGKNTVLGCGFQMGWEKFQRRYAKDRTDEFCQGVIHAYRKVWAPEVPKHWYGLEAAAAKCVCSGRPTEAYGVEFRLEDGWLTARLPSGRKLWYYGPTPTVGTWPDGRPKDSYRYSAQKTGVWTWVGAYGGLITENVVQALARDLMVYAMFRCEREGMPIVLTVHDEIVCEVDAGRADPKMLQQIMEDRPEWAIDIRTPIAAECWAGDRYKK